MSGVPIKASKTCRLLVWAGVKFLIRFLILRWGLSMPGERARLGVRIQYVVSSWLPSAPLLKNFSVLKVLTVQHNDEKMEVTGLPPHSGWGERYTHKSQVVTHKHLSLSEEGHYYSLTHRKS